MRIAIVMFFLQIKIENAVKSVKARDFDVYVAVGRFHKR
jgi:hypothetical protein